MKATLTITVEWDNDLLDESGEDDPKIVREEMTKQLYEQTENALKTNTLEEHITFTYE